MLKKKTNELYNAASFVIAAVSIYIILSFIGVVGGDYSIINGDMKDNYIPAILNLLRSIKNGESIFYSWDYGMGMNTSLLNAYYAYNPFNLVYFLCPAIDENIVTVFLIMIKTGLTALCFRIFICKVYNSEGVFSLIIPLCYSLCSYQVIYNTQNIIWLDAMFVLPLICLEINRLVREGRWMWLAFWYAYIFTTQFYMGYMIGIISACYFAMCIIVYGNKKMRVKSCMQYAGAISVALGLSAWAWIPTLMFLRESLTAGTSTYDKVYLSVADIFNQLFWGEVSDYDAAFPYIYCGLPTVIFAIRYFGDRDNNIKEKVGFGTILILLVASCLLMPLYIFWHGFDSPNSFGFRFSFIISFILCVIAAIETGKEERNKITIRWALPFVILVAALYLVIMIIQKRRYNDINLSNSIIFLYINVGLVILWIIGYGLMDKRKIVGGLLILLIVAELLSNGYVVITGRDKDGRRLTFEEYTAWKLSQTEAAKLLNQDDSFYRVNSLNDLGPSSGLYYGYKSMSYFGSAENIKLRNVLGYLGLWNSPRIVYGYGLTPVTNMLLGVKYNIVGDPSIDGTADAYSHHSNIYIDRDALGLGYMVNGEPEQYYIPSTDAFENNNYLLSLMTGSEVTAFSKVNDDDIVIWENGLKFNWSGQEMVISSQEGDNNQYWGAIIYILNDNGSDYYAYVDNDSSYYTENAYILADGYENYINHNGAMTVSYIKHIDRFEDGVCLRITSLGYKGEERFNKLCIASYNNEEKERAYEALKENVFSVSEYDNGYVKGEIEATAEKKLMFTTIPFEVGWSAYVDGKPEDIVPLMNDTLIGVRLNTPGRHIVEFRFAPPGQKIGVVFTLISICLYVLAGIKLMKNKSNMVKLDE